jgi:phosphonate C-P lyase system protein PhnG
MTKEQVFEAIMGAAPGDVADGGDIAGLAGRLRGSVAHAVVKRPRQELVMFRAEENVEKLDFNVGEVLVTSAEVRVADALGYSAVMSLDEDLALDCAFLMGVYEAGLPEKAAVEELARLLAERAAARRRQEREIADSTRVRFELMGGQDPNIKHNQIKEEKEGADE